MTMNIFSLLSLPSIKYVYLYTQPINMSWGKDKLLELCIHEMKLYPKTGDIFMFHNKKKDKIKFFFYDDLGYQEFMKILPKGGFLVPISSSNETYIKTSAAKLPSLFRL